MSFDPNSNSNPYQAPAMGAMPAAYAEETERQAFIRRTYTHLAGAVLAFVGVQAILFAVVDKTQMINFVFQPPVWIGIIIGAMIVSWVADSWARRRTSVGMQYAGLGLYVLVESFLLAPLLMLATLVGDEILPTAALMTGIIFGGLTLMVMVTKADFSWLRGILVAVGLGVMGLIVCSLIFGFSLGLGFTVAMIVFVSAIVLYQTSMIMRNYPTDMHVAASLGLFASVMTMLWHILWLLIQMAGDD